MKGVVLSELVRFVELQFSPEVADTMIRKSKVSSDGAYTSVGNYPHVEALALIGALAEITGKPAPELAEAYGYWLSGRFVELYPAMFAGYTDVRSFLKDVDAKMHKEVKKLYEDANTPAVIAEIDGEELNVAYSSHRPFADVAFGLVRGYVDYFKEPLVVERDAADPGPNTAHFVLRKIARADSCA
jgi:Haem-NO-binding